MWPVGLFGAASPRRALARCSLPRRSWPGAWSAPAAPAVSDGRREWPKGRPGRRRLQPRSQLWKPSRACQPQRPI
eukprot:1528273-Lingulodinium_polyedra.AAC.1